MVCEDVLVMAMALPPMGLAARLWWSARHAAGELRDSCALAIGPRRPDAAGFDAAQVAERTFIRPVGRT